VTQAPMAVVSNALVALHKEQFGRGPTKAHTALAGPDTLVCVFRNALLPAELALVEMGEANRVREARLFYHAATERRFSAAVEEILGRKVISCTSAVDPNHDVVVATFLLEPAESEEPHRTAGLQSAEH
jgi:uncharacterized protein YbcI